MADGQDMEQGESLPQTSSLHEDEDMATNDEYQVCYIKEEPEEESSYQECATSSDGWVAPANESGQRWSREEDNLHNTNQIHVGEARMHTQALPTRQNNSVIGGTSTGFLQVHHLYRMAPKGKLVNRKGRKSREDDIVEKKKKEEIERQKAAEEGQGETAEREEEEVPGVESDAESTTSGTGRQNLSRNEFNSEDEARLVKFFEKHDEFYNKGSSKYCNTQHKKKVLDQLATQLNCNASKIQGWFKNQRTQVGKMMNPHSKKSGSGQEVMTVRKKWQMNNFQFLRAYIVPRSYTHDTEPPEISATSAEPGSANRADDDDNVPSANSSVIGVSEEKRRKRPRTQTFVDEALLKFLERPRESEIVAQKMQERELRLSAEREAFLQWFGSRLHRVSEEKWDSFSEDAHQILRKYTTTTPTSNITTPSAALGAPHQPTLTPHHQTFWQWQHQPEQQQRPVLSTPQWQQWQQQPQWRHPRWQPTQHQLPTKHQVTQKQSTGQQPHQPDIQMPGRSYSTPMSGSRQDDPLFDLTHSPMLSRSLTPMLKESEVQPQPLITQEPTATSNMSKGSGDDASDEGGQE